MKLKKVFLKLEGENVAYEAYVSDKRMANGCYLPYMEHRVIGELMFNSNYKFRTILSWHGSILIWLDPDQPDDEIIIMRPTHIFVKKVFKLVWDVGDIGLMWEVATGKEKTIITES